MPPAPHANSTDPGAEPILSEGTHILLHVSEHTGCITMTTAWVDAMLTTNKQFQCIFIGPTIKYMYVMLDAT